MRTETGVSACVGRDAGFLGAFVAFGASELPPICPLLVLQKIWETDNPLILLVPTEGLEPPTP